MTDHGPNVASDAIDPTMATPATPTIVDASPSGVPTSATDDIPFGAVTALTDELAYTLTAEQAREHYATARRKVPSLRTIQRYCDEQRIAAQKIRTTYGSEWLINEDSLAKLIEAEPVVASVAATPNLATTAAPVTLPPLLSAPAGSANSDAGDAGADELASPVGERRRLADVLIENAKLVAERDGKDALIEELKEDRAFLREEVREGRRNRDDVKNIAQQMLDTLKTMAIGRLAAPYPPPEPVQTDVIHHDHRQM